MVRCGYAAICLSLSARVEFVIFLPIGTDAPLYHYPITTVGLIITNIVCFGVMVSSGQPDSWVLEFSHIDPIEWVTNMFAHAGPGHLLGNMFFLWGFGLIVEGKIGWARTLCVYMIIGIVESAIIQAIMCAGGATEGGALGASAAIMGFMAISLIWAPKNEVKLFVFFWFVLIVRAFVWDVTVMMFACVYLALDLASFLIIDQGVGSAALHLTGALVGLGVGVLFVKRDWVDCENWDLFAVMACTYGRNADPTTAVGSHADPTLMFGHSNVKVQDEIQVDTRQSLFQKELETVNGLIDSGQYLEASDRLVDLNLQQERPLDERRLGTLAKGLLRSDMHEEAEVLLEEYVDRFPDDAHWARVRLAHALLKRHKCPGAALRQLKQVRLSQLSHELEVLAKNVVRAAKAQVKAGGEDAEREW